MKPHLKQAAAMLGLPLSLYALAIASFGIGTTEFVIMGLLPDVAHDLGVTIPAAGMLIGGYALSVTFGSPLMAAALSGFRRKSALLMLVAIFVLGNLLCAIAPTYPLLMAARLLTALCHGTFFGIGAVVATTLVPASKRSLAISIMFSGLTLANVLGVPLGTALGQAAGWRATFWAIVPIGLLAAFAIARWLPATVTTTRSRLRQELRILGRPAVLLPMLVSVLASASLFATFTYIAPLLETVSGIPASGVTIVLILFGLGITGGNLMGGRLGDWRQITALAGIMGALVLILILFAGVAASPWPATTMVVIWGFVHFACGSPLQGRVVDAASDAPNLASVLNQSAFNLGNALGAALGAQALQSGMSYAGLPYISAALAALALGVVLLDGTMSRRRSAFASGVV